jgi:hypothetical protein
MIRTRCWLKPAAEDKQVVVVAREVVAVIRVEVAPVVAQIRVEAMPAVVDMFRLRAEMLAVVSVVAGRFTHRQ